MRIPPAAVFSAVLGVAVCGFGAAWMWNQRQQATTPVQDPGLPEMRIPAFDLVDQDGDTVTESVLDGEYTVAGFIFTNCPGLCPMMTMTMADAQQRLADTGARFISFSLDAERDTPAAMRAYGERFGADFDSWVFATGSTSVVRDIVRNGLTLVVEDEADNQITTADGGTMANIQHPTRLVLIGPARAVLGFYTVSDISGIERLEADVRRLLAR